jgi:hypothetical protein
MAFNTGLEHLFHGDDELYECHPEASGGWSQQQLTPILDQLGLPESKMNFAIAALLRDVVIESRCISRKPNDYHKRYASRNDRYCTYHYRKGATDWLEMHGYIERHQGIKGHPTVLCATDKARELTIPSDPPALPYRPEVIVLRNRSTKQDIDYQETRATGAMRTQLELFNDNVSGRQFVLDGEPHQIPYMRRIFNDTFTQGGLFFCRGHSFQKLKKRQRLRIVEVIQGGPYPWSELDFDNFHLALAYAEMGVPLPAGDLYAIDGFPRETSKRGHLMMENTADQTSCLRCMSTHLHLPWSRSIELMDAIKRKHPAIADTFHTDSGVRYQFQGSEILAEVMQRVFDSAGRVPLPLHDAIYVPACDLALTSDRLTHVLQERNLDVRVSVAP